MKMSAGPAPGGVVSNVSRAPPLSSGGGLPGRSNNQRSQHRAQDQRLLLNYVHQLLSDALQGYHDHGFDLSRWRWTGACVSNEVRSKFVMNIIESSH